MSGETKCPGCLGPMNQCTTISKCRERLDRKQFIIEETSRDETHEFLAPLGLMLPITVEDVRRAYLARVATTHPDTGGDVDSFKKLQGAFERALDHARRHDLGWIRSMVEAYVEQQGVIGKVIVLGGEVETEQLEWLKQEVGDGFALLSEKVIGIRLHGPQISDEILAYLGGKHRVLTSLRWLDLSRTQITSRGLKLLCRLPKLQWVRLHQTPISWWDRFKLRRAFWHLRCPYRTSVFRSFDRKDSRAQPSFLVAQENSSAH